MLASTPAPAVRAEIDSQSTVNGDVGRNNPNVLSSPRTSASIPGVVTDGGIDAIAVVIPVEVADIWPFASSSCNRAFSSAVSWMYDAGGRGKSGGGVRGGVKAGTATCLWSRERESSVRVGEGFPGDGLALEDEWYSC